MNTAEKSNIHKEIAANAFFHDFLLFVQEARREPFRLTEKGNLRLGDIHYFGEHFHQDIIRRYIFGENGEYIRSEKHVPKLRRIRLLASHMGLVERNSSNRKLCLSQTGKTFLDRLSLQAQFELVILDYLKRYEWAEWYSWCARIATLLQREQRALWSYFLHRQNTRIEFSQFLSGLRQYFKLDDLIDNPSPYSDWVLSDVKRILILDLRLFGLFSVESVESETLMDEEIIHAFQPTELGLHIFTLALAEGASTQTKGEGERSVS